MVQPVDRHSQNSLSHTDPLFSKGWSVDEFDGLSRQRLFGVDGMVELVDGEVCPLPSGEGLERQIKLLQFQIQQHLNVWGLEPYEVRSRHPIKINQYSELKPAIAVMTKATVKNKPKIHWVIDMTDEGLNQAHTRRSQLVAQADIADYWSMTVLQVELRTYQSPTPTGYQQCKLLHVGDRATPTILPQITLQLQEPLPLSFLTRTLGGQRAYPSAALPLQVCSPDY